MRSIEEIDHLIESAEKHIAVLQEERREVINRSNSNKSVAVRLPDGSLSTRPVDYEHPSGRRVPVLHEGERLLMAPGRLPQILELKE